MIGGFYKLIACLYQCKQHFFLCIEKLTPLNQFNMRKSTLLTFAACLLFMGLACSGQTIYGVPGTIKTPNAYIAPNGKFLIGMGFFHDYHFNHNDPTKQWTLNLDIGVHSRFELGIRLLIIPGWKGDSPFYDAYFDRMINGKVILIKEKEKFPQLSFGMQDAVGTRYHNCTYLVATKNLKLYKAFNCLVSLGYGSKLSDLALGDATDHNFIGFFGSSEIAYKNRLVLMGEYDARNFNTGLKLALADWLNFNLTLLKLQYPSAGLSFKITL